MTYMSTGKRRAVAKGMQPGRVVRTLRNPHDHAQVWARAGELVLVGPPDACRTVPFVTVDLPGDRLRYAWHADIEPLTEDAS